MRETHTTISTWTRFETGFTKFATAMNITPIAAPIRPEESPETMKDWHGSAS